MEYTSDDGRGYRNEPFVVGLCIGIVPSMSIYIEEGYQQVLRVIFHHAIKDDNFKASKNIAPINSIFGSPFECPIHPSQIVFDSQ